MFAGWQVSFSPRPFTMFDFVDGLSELFSISLNWNLLANVLCDSIS